MIPDTLRVLGEVVAALDRHSIPYVVGGSVASGAWGEPRSTHDVDVLTRPRPEQTRPLLEEFEHSYYIESASMREPTHTYSAFNMIHLKLFVKVDLFVAEVGVLDTEQLERRVQRSLHRELEPMYVTSPEITVLRKLDWSRKGNGESERQLRDVVSVLKTQRDTIDVAYMRRIAATVGLESALARAMQAAGLEER